MLILVFDTETTDLLDFKLDLLHEDQKARVCQLGAALVDSETREVVDQMECLIKPDGWDEIAPAAFEAHGITIERCEAEGIPMAEALSRFNEMKARAHVRVAFNLNFDKRMMAREAALHGIEHNSEGLESFCAMLNCVKIVNLPPTDKMLAAGIRKPKTPNLTEAYTHFFGEGFDGAHSALADVLATVRVYFAILDHQSAQAA